MNYYGPRGREAFEFVGDLERKDHFIQNLAHLPKERKKLGICFRL